MIYGTIKCTGCGAIRTIADTTFWAGSINDDVLLSHPCPACMSIRALLLQCKVLSKPDPHFEERFSYMVNSQTMLTFKARTIGPDEVAAMKLLYES